MAVFRVNKTSDFTTMSNQHLKNKNLSLKAKGLLSLMLALPDDWGYSIKGLVSICKENETSIKNTLDELKTNGYLKILKLKPNETSSKKIEYIYDIYEQPIENQDIENLPLDNQHLENQKLEKHTQINTNILNIDKPNTNKLNTNNNVIPIVPLVEKRTCEYHISEGSTCSREAKLMIGSTNLCGQHARIYLTKLGESQLLKYI